MAVTQSQARVLARTVGILVFGICFALVLDHATGSGGGGSSQQRVAAAPVSAPEPAPAQVPAILGGRRAAPAPVSSAFVGMPMIGALFTIGQAAVPGQHFCTGSVIDSPGGNLIATAAHCLEDPANGSNTIAPFVFVPGYHDGQAPFGTWTPVKVFVDPHWATNSNPDYDIAFAVLRETGHPAARLAHVVGSEHIAFGAKLPAVVSGIGYPSNEDQPIACLNTLTVYQPTQSEFDCGGFTNGSSGGPLLVGVDPTTGRGSLVGVIGGYQEGGYTAAISYASALGPAVQSLYQQATATP